MGALDILGEKKPSDTALGLLGEASVRKPARTRPGLGATLGGAVGQIAGAPLGLGGSSAAAGVGGAVGEVVQQGLEQGALGGPGPPLAGALIDPGLLARAGAEQGAYGLAGGLLGKGAGFVANRTMSAALAATPEVAQTAISEGIKATRGGLAKLMTKLGAAGAATRELLDNATRRLGATYQPADIAVEAAKSVMRQPGAAAFGEAEGSQLAKMAKDFMGNYKTAMTPSRLHRIVQKYDDLAAPIYQKMARKEVLAPGEDVAAQYYKAVADQGRSMLNNLPSSVTGSVKLPNGAIVSSVKDANAYTGKLIELKDAVWPEVKRGVPFSATLARRGIPLAAGAGIGAAMPGDLQQRVMHGAEFGLGMSLLGNPAALSQTALLLNNPLLLGILGQAPRALGQVSQ